MLTVLPRSRRGYPYPTLVLALFAASCATSRREPTTRERPQIEAEHDADATTAAEAELLELIRTRFVDAIDPDDLADATSHEVLRALPYHNVVSAERQTSPTADETDDDDGETGVILDDDDTGIFIANIIQFSPADVGELAIGDRILAVDDQPVDGHSADSIQRYLHGAPQTAVELIVTSGGERLTRRVRLRRQELLPVSIYFERASRHVGYIRVSWFGRRTLLHFDQAIERLRTIGTRAFVLDLRSNPGGAVNVAVRLADRLLPEGSLLVERVSRHAERRARDIARGGSNKMLAPIAVLIDDETASAAELFVAALRDNGRTELYADARHDRTIGKGTGQFEYPLASAELVVRITEELYLRPDGRPIEGFGVSPDHRIVVDSELRRALSEHGLPAALSYSLADRPFNDPVLDAAIVSLGDLVQSSRD